MCYAFLRLMLHRFSSGWRATERGGTNPGGSRASEPAHGAQHEPRQMEEALAEHLRAAWPGAEPIGLITSSDDEFEQWLRRGLQTSRASSG